MNSFIQIVIYLSFISIFLPGTISTTPEKKEETSPLRSDVSIDSSYSNLDRVMPTPDRIEAPTQLDQMMAMLV